jgi:hypothetical protein
MPAGCRTIVVDTNVTRSPSVTFSYTPGADPNFPSVFSRMMTKEDADLKLVSLAIYLYCSVVTDLLRFAIPASKCRNPTSNAIGRALAPESAQFDPSKTGGRISCYMWYYGAGSMLFILRLITIMQISAKSHSSRYLGFVLVAVGNGVTTA